MVTFVRPGEPAGSPGGVEIVNPDTGETIGSLSRIQFQRAKARGEVFETLEPRPEVQLSIRKREEKKNTSRN